MDVRVIVPPRPVVSLDLLKLHLGVEHGDDDFLISMYGEAVTSWIDGPAGGWLGRPIGLQTIEARLNEGAFHTLPFGPTLQVDRVEYDGPAGVVTVEPEEYALNGDMLSLLGSAGYPRQGYKNARARYVVGSLNPPAAIKAAIMLMVGHLYENRSAVVTEKPETLPLGAEALLAPFRVWN